ncbi:MAG: GNAT family N-acetyltransferase [Candidatus Helarchaeota archaeon]|nr:GNAT family N-acetyltransferase [Candidatus Helarchaeota archaeon]
MLEQFELKNGTLVTIKRLFVDDYEKDNNYEFVHSWLHKVDRYLGMEFLEEELENDKASWYKSLANLEEMINIGALHEEKIIGSVSLQIKVKNKRLQHRGEWGITIHPDFQNNGLGTRLLEIIEVIAREKGLIRLEAGYVEGNEIAVHLYVNKMGYTIEGRCPFALRYDNGTYEAEILIGKILDG